MLLVESHPVSLTSSEPFKMEDRKRLASNDHENAGPPLKRQATTVNGAGRSHPDADMPWQDDLEVSLIRHLNLDTLSRSGQCVIAC